MKSSLSAPRIKDLKERFPARHRYDAPTQPYCILFLSPDRSVHPFLILHTANRDFPPCDSRKLLPLYLYILITWLS